MVLLEPLLGTGLEYTALVEGVNNFCQSRRYKEGGEAEVSDNVRRFLEVVTGHWQRNRKRKVEEEAVDLRVGEVGRGEVRREELQGGREEDKRNKGAGLTRIKDPVQGRKAEVQDWRREDMEDKRKKSTGQRFVAASQGRKGEIQPILRRAFI